MLLYYIAVCAKQMGCDFSSTRNSLFISVNYNIKERSQVLSQSRILEVLVSEGVVSVSEGVVSVSEGVVSVSASVSDGQVSVSDNEVLTTTLICSY